MAAKTKSDEQRRSSQLNASSTAQCQHQRPEDQQQQRRRQQPIDVGASGGKRPSNGGGGGSSGGNPPCRTSAGNGLVGDRATTMATMTMAPREGAGAVTAAAVTPTAGVVIRVLISGAHASFLHMRVFPSTTAGQVRNEERAELSRMFMRG